MHPYEVAQTLRTRAKHESIRLNYGSLYSVVESLEHRGLIEATETVRHGRRPERTVYAPHQRPASVSCSTGSPSSSPRRSRSTSSSRPRSSLLPVLPPEDAVALLRQRAAAARAPARRDRGSRPSPSSRRAAPAVRARAASTSSALRAAELDFVHRLVKDIESGELTGLDVWQQLVRRRTPDRRSATEPAELRHRPDDPYLRGSGPPCANTETRSPTSSDPPRRCRTRGCSRTVGRSVLQGSLPRQQGVTMTPIVEARGLTKRYGRVQALDGLDLVAEPGQVVALLGPNGAGKTTFVRTIATLVRPDGGTLAGEPASTSPADPKEVRRVIGLAGQDGSGRAGHDRPREPRDGRSAVRPRSAGGARSASGRVLEQLDLTDVADRLVPHLLGRHAPPARPRRQPRRLAPPAAPRRADDRPRSPQPPRAVGARSAPWSATAPTSSSRRSTSRRPTSSPSQIVIIDHGRVIASGTPSELKAQGRARRRRDPPSRRRRPRRHRRPPWRTSAPSRLGSTTATRTVAIAVDGGNASLLATVRTLDDLSVVVDDIALRRPTLDEVFLDLTGQPLDATDPARDTRRRQEIAP